MKYVKQIFAMLICLCSLIGAGCSSDNTNNPVLTRVNFANLINAELKDSVYTNVSLLKTYGNEDICKDTVANANLYVCIDLDNGGDTLYVFETCRKVPAFAKGQLNENFAILKENVKRDAPVSVAIMVPQSFKIPEHSKFIFSSLTRLVD